ncbi:MAG: hypothetical protein AB1779_00280 [Candidatus Thermoplasmatota archaeon]
MKPNTLLTIIGITLVLIGSIGALTIQFQPVHKVYEKNKYRIGWMVLNDYSGKAGPVKKDQTKKIPVEIIEHNNLTNVSFIIQVNDRYRLSKQNPANVHIVIKAPNGTTEIEDTIIANPEAERGYVFVIARVPNEIVVMANDEAEALKKISVYSSTNGTGNWTVEVSYTRNRPTYIMDDVIEVYIDAPYDYYIANITKITTGAV